jgi:predicted RNA-binding protein YlqC (UPF0109 family)
MKDLVEYIAKSLADHPEEVAVTEVTSKGEAHLKLKVSDDDLGRVIGRGGRVANSIRVLLRVAAARRGVRTTLDIL